MCLKIVELDQREGIERTQLVHAESNGTSSQSKAKVNFAYTKVLR